MQPGDEITFDYRKQLSYIRDLGAGGTGSTYLFKDETTDILFAVKKFDPKSGNNPQECFDRFVDEIKILLKLNHPNIVRVFNYFLSPKNLVGYLQMEFISGVSIDKFHVSQYTKNWNEIFSDTISAFEAMELKGVLHRDIKPQNVMIDNDGIVRVIDFGFGKHYLHSESLDENSVLLNWPFSLPDETTNNATYNHRTEIYFLGKLFESVLNPDDCFDYHFVVTKMCEKNPNNRYDSFAQIRETLNASYLDGETFTEEQKGLYQEFANTLVSRLAKLKSSLDLVVNPDIVLQNLEKLLRNSSLEMVIQDNAILINCFIHNTGFSYWPDRAVEVDLVRRFYDFLFSLKESGRQAVLNNLAVRLGKVEVESVYDEDIPF